MRKSEVARRYAKSLFRISATPEVLRKRLDDLTKLGHVLQDEKFLHFISAPHISNKQKKEVMHKGWDKRVDPLLVSYLSFLLDKGRLNELSSIVWEYGKMVRAKLKTPEANLITASLADPQTVTDLKAKLDRLYGEEFEIVEKINPKLIGGAILVVGCQMIDFSVKDRIQRLKEKLMAIPISK